MDSCKSGKTVIQFDEKGTTRTCHACDHVVQGGLNPCIRKWSCSKCGTAHIRDENASINGHRKILRDLPHFAISYKSKILPSSLK